MKPTASDTGGQKKAAISKLSQADLFEQLKAIAVELGATYKEHRFKTSPVSVKSGFCRVHGELFFIMDSRKRVGEKNRILGKALARMGVDTMDMPNLLRDFIQGSL